MALEFAKTQRNLVNSSMNATKTGKVINFQAVLMSGSAVISTGKINGLGSVAWKEKTQDGRNYVALMNLVEGHTLNVRAV